MIDALMGFSAIKFNVKVPAGAYFAVIESAAWLATRLRMSGVVWALDIEIFMNEWVTKTRMWSTWQRTDRKRECLR